MSQLQVTGEAKIRDIQGPVVANSGVITALDGAASQYVRGDGTLADFPTSTGGGSSVSYYLNSSVSQGTIGGVAYRELSKEPIIGAGTDITISANGYVASYITDANDPDVLSVPGGNFNCEFYFSVNNNTGNPTTYAELYKYDGTTFTLLGSSVGVPESLNQGTTIAPYYFAIPVATAALALTDRLAIRIYVSVDGRVVTLHTENSHLCQVVTTFSKGMVSLNNLTDQSQFITTGTSGTDFNIVSTGDTHTFNIPSASASNRGLITTGSQTIAGDKTFSGFSKFNLTASFDEPAIFEYASMHKYNILTGGATGNITTYGRQSGGISGFQHYFDTLFSTILNFDNTANRTYTFPNASGTLALTSNLSSYVPYNGATTTVNLGTNGLNAGPIKTENGYAFKILASGTPFENGYSVLSSLSGNVSITQAISAGNLKAFTFDFSAWATNTTRTYTLPDLSGTLALLEGTQTFSGAKTFTENPIINGTGTNSAYTILQSAGTNKWRIGNNYAAGVNTFDIFAYDNSSTPLSINSNGAMTLSANVTTTGAQFVQNGFYLTNANGGSLAGYTHMWARNEGINFGLRNGTGGASFIFPSANSYNYTFPAASGTISLTSDLSAYLPLTGGTLTGNLTLNSSSLLRLGNSDNASTMQIWNSQSGGINNLLIYDNAANAYRFVIGNTGNVGIGTSSPNDLLELKTTSANQGNLRLYNTFNNGANNYGIYWYRDYDSATNSLACSIYYGRDGGSSGNMIFSTGTVGNISPRMTITSGGNVGIGTSTAPYLLTLALPSGVNGEIIRMSRSAGAYAWSLGIDSATSHFNFYNNSSTSVANINLSTGAYTATSDERLKENILDSDNAIEKLLQIKVRKYDWKDTDIKEDYGFVAQELYDVLPQYVSKGDEDRNWGVAKAELVPILVKAIQELESRIKQLENK